MNPAGLLTEEQQEAVIKECRKWKAQEFRDEMALALAQMVRDFNWLMTEQRSTQAQAQKVSRQIDEVMDFLREVAAVDIDNPVSH